MESVEVYQLQASGDYDADSESGYDADSEPDSEPDYKYRFEFMTDETESDDGYDGGSEDEWYLDTWWPAFTEPMYKHLAAAKSTILFPQFAKLPTELQIMIWEQAALEESPEVLGGRKMMMGIKCYGRPMVYTECPLLYVCSLSRKIAFENIGEGKPHYVLGRGPVIKRPFRPELDILDIGTQDFTLAAPTWFEALKPHVRRVAILTWDNDPGYWTILQPKFALPSILWELKSLESLHMIHKLEDLHLPATPIVSADVATSSSASILHTKHAKVHPVFPLVPGWGEMPGLYPELKEIETFMRLFMSHQMQQPDPSASVWDDDNHAIWDYDNQKIKLRVEVNAIAPKYFGRSEMYYYQATNGRFVDWWNSGIVV